MIKQLKTQKSSTTQTNSKGDRSSDLVLLFPIALGIALIVYAWRWLIVLGVLSAMGGLWKYYQHKQQERQEWLNVIFYQTLQEHQGRIATLDLAIAAKIPGVEAQEFLQKKAKEFGAEFEVTDAGGILFIFSSLSMPNPQSANSNSNSNNKEPWRSLDSAPKQLPEARDESWLSPLKQSELAERFGVHSSTISKNKIKSDFISWSRKKDPAGVAWTYSPETKEFFPLASK